MAQRSTDQLRNATATFVRYCSPMAILQGQSDGSFKNSKDLRDTTSVARGGSNDCIMLNSRLRR
jgi:hypothetical protein